MLAKLTISIMAILGSIALLGSGCGPTAGWEDNANGNGYGDNSNSNDNGNSSGNTNNFPAPDAGFDSDAGCAAYTQSAEETVLPTDIIIAVDQSGSMSTEVGWVQNQLNAFSQQIMAANIDVHVVLIAERPGGPVGEHPLCVPPPLGGPNCADNPPVFTQINQHVDSEDALIQILATYNQYEHVLRPEARKHIIVISDDHSDIGAGIFHLGITSQPKIQDYTFHAIVCTWDCSVAADIGDEYIDLVAMTGGVLGDLCAQNFTPVWDEVSTQVIEGTQLTCEWTIPDPPPGEEIDPERVNVVYTNGAVQTDLTRVDSLADCAGFSSSWYYDDPANPTTILACPDLCTQIQGVPEPQIDIVFGCSTIIPPPQ